MRIAITTPSVRTYFGLIPLALGGIAAHLQASAINHLIAAAITTPRIFVLPPSQPKTSTTAKSRSGSAKTILRRNVFDSTTGPIDPEPKSPPAALVPTDPLSAANCQGTRALIISESTDRAWSSATLQGPGDATPKLRRVGDLVMGAQVAFIGYNPRYQQPSVWLVAGNDLCQSPLFASAAALANAAPASTRAPGVGGSQHDRAEKPQNERGQWFRSVRVAPEFRDGKVIGLRLAGIQKASLLGLLGLRSGDVLETINGYSIANAEQALEAYVRLRTAERLSVRLVREGQSTTINYRIL
jgi:general secretion pathway protein C